MSLPLLGFEQLNAEPVQDFKEYKGIVLDKNTREPLIFADVNVNETNISTITNAEGEFLLKVPKAHQDKSINISFLGYKKRTISLAEFKDNVLKIDLETSITSLDQINIKAFKDATALVKAVLKNKGNNYGKDQSIMTAFYRETIKKRRKNASLSEAVVQVYKQPYTSNRKDAIKLIKARKKTNYSKLDTLALKLQGGPHSTLYADMIKYPEYIFQEKSISDYQFNFEPSTQVNNRALYVVRFKQKPGLNQPLYYGKLFIDAESLALTSAVYSLNVTNRKLAAALYIRKKPTNVVVYPTHATYRVDYRVSNNKWHYGYSNIQLAFKVKWKNKLFNSQYTLNMEMAVTDWENNNDLALKSRDRLSPNVILTDKASGFSDPEFWGEYNIIEPEKSIESAIKKINRQLKRQRG